MNRYEDVTPAESPKAMMQELREIKRLVADTAGLAMQTHEKVRLLERRHFHLPVGVAAAALLIALLAFHKAQVAEAQTRAPATIGR